MPSSQRKKCSRTLTAPPARASSRVVSTPNGRGDVQVVDFTAGPHAARLSSEDSDAHTVSGVAS